jgi:hypothetical protein
VTWTELSQIVTAAAALGAVVGSLRNARKIDSVHISLNSRLTEMLRIKDETMAAAVDAAMSKGHAAGIQEQKDRTG